MLILWNDEMILKMLFAKNDETILFQQKQISNGLSSVTFASFGSTNNNITMINNNNNNKCKCPEDVTSMLRNYIDRKLFQSFSKKLRKSWNLFFK